MTFAQPERPLSARRRNRAGRRRWSACHPWRFIAFELAPRSAVLTADDAVRRIAAERAHVDERSAVGIRLKPAVAIGWDVLWLCDPEEPATLGLLAANIQSKRRPNDRSQHL